MNVVRINSVWNQPLEFFIEENNLCGNTEVVVQHQVHKKSILILQVSRVM